MSSASAANTETIVLAESANPLQRSPSQPDSPSRQDPREFEDTANVDGRSSDADKMLESAGALLGMEGMEGDEVGPEVIDASEQGPPDQASAGDESQSWDDDEHNLKRVKVYELIGSRWVDQGTAFCYGHVHNDEAFLVARAENDFNQVIMSTTIRNSDVYQRQQDTLIVWTEPDGVDYALSFQDPEGCTEVWRFIQEVQKVVFPIGLSSSPLIGPEPAIASSLMRGGNLPKPSLSTITDIERTVKTVARIPALKERICEFIQSDDYMKSLVAVFVQAEDLESLDNLHTLCSCMQSILMLNDHTLYEHILENDVFFGVVGMLEYDPEFPTHKANYREFLRQSSRYHQPIPIRDDSVQRKVHHTYRLQFLKDVVLARAIDDSTFNVLNSCILFNQIDIINHVQSDQTFLREVVGTFLDEEMLKGLVPRGKELDGAKKEDKMDVDQKTGSSSQSNGAAKRQLSEAEVKHRREVVLLIQQLCVMGKNVQLPARMALFRSLSDRGILFAVQWALGQPESEPEGLQMISAAGEVLTCLLDHDVNGVRAHVLKQLGPPDLDKNGPRRIDHDTVVSVLCRVLVKSRDLAVQSQISEALRSLLEIPPNDALDQHPMGQKVFQRPKDDPGTERFMEYFYKHCVDVLFNPLLDLPDFKNISETHLTLTRERTNLYLHLCDLLACFALQHSFRSHFYMLSSSISAHVASLLRAKDKHLRLAAFRFFRVLLRLNNRNLFNHLIKIDALGPILDLTLRESRRDNLLSSTCQEFFEHIRKENIKELIHSCMTKHESRIRELATTPLGGPRFSAFIRRWEINIEPPPKEDEKATKPSQSGPRRWGQGSLLESEEEDYFNGDDDEEEPFGATLFPGSGKNALKRKRPRGASVPPLRPQQSPLLRTAALGSLLDYDDGDEPTAVPSVEDAPFNVVLAARPHAVALQGQQGVPASPRLAHRQIAAEKPAPDAVEDPEDSLLESLVSGAGSSPASKSPPDELAPGLKRRRDDEDDEGLERLVNKAKKPTADASPGVPGKDKMPGTGTVFKLGMAKTLEEGPKKIKLKLSSPTSQTPSPSSPGVKDGDTG